MNIFNCFRVSLLIALALIGLPTETMDASRVNSKDDAGLYGVIAPQDSELANKIELLKKRLVLLQGNLGTLLERLVLLKQGVAEKVVDTTLLEELALDMKYYKTTSTGFHSGHLYEHSMWVAMVIDRWFEERSGNIQPSNAWESGAAWLEGVEENDRSITVLAGFLHDVGKASNPYHYYQYHKLAYFDTSHPIWPSYPSYHNISSHPKDGFEFLTKNLAYERSIDKGSANFRQKGTLDFAAFFQQLKLSDEQQQIIQILAGIHWDFGGEVMVKGNNKSFLDKLATLVKKVNYNNGIVNERIVRLAILIGAADVRGAQGEAPQDFANFKNRYPWFKGDVFEKPIEHGQYTQYQKRFAAFDYPGKGITLKNKLLDYFKNTWKQSQLLQDFNGYNFSLLCYFTPILTST